MHENLTFCDKSLHCSHTVKNIKIKTLLTQKQVVDTPTISTDLESCFLCTCNEIMLTGESQFHISTLLGTWTQVPYDGKQMGSQLDQWDMVRMKWDCRLSTGLPPSSRLCQLWSRTGDLQWAWNQGRRAVWDQVGLSHCPHEGLVMVQDEARLRQAHRNDQSCHGHQWSETPLTGESWFHISTPPPRDLNPGPLWREANM
jgi:hypothetical protein